MNDIIVGLDIGTSNVRVVIAEFDENDVLQVIGVGKSPSTGLRSGVIVNIEATMRAVTTAIESAEMMAGREVTNCIIGIGGSQVESTNSKGLVAVTNRGKGSREINRNDIERVIEAARAVVIPMDREIIHVVPQSYIVDGQPGIKDPTNMIGVRLEAEVHIITAVSTSAQNFYKCVQRAGYTSGNLLSKTLAETMAVVTDEERELGSILIDLGGGSTDVLVLIDGAPVYSTSLPVGGIMVTNDISIVRGISTETAEKIKISSGCCWEGLLEEYEEVIIPGVGGRPPEAISRLDICKIIQPRIEEVLNMVRERIAQQTKLKQLSGNVILTGGGALMPGVVEIACKVFDTPSVRVGVPGNFGSIMEEYRTPEYATAIGLIVASASRYGRADDAKSTDEKHPKQANKFWKNVGTFFKEFF